MTEFFRRWWAIAFCCAVSGCGALAPGFSPIEQPLLYAVSANDVAAQISCELREFFLVQQLKKRHRQPSIFDQRPGYSRWLLDDSPSKVTITLTTDISGKVGYLGIDLSKIGQLFTLTNQTVVTTTSSSTVKVPSLQASLQGKRTAKAAMVVSIPQRPTAPDVTQFDNEIRAKERQGLDREQAEELALYDVSGCPDWARRPDHKLYLEKWLEFYFNSINQPTCKYDGSARVPRCAPDKETYQTVTLTTAFTIVFDVNAGIAPTPAGFLIPVSGANFDISPDYTHNIDIALTLCGPTPKECEPQQTKLSDTQLKHFATNTRF